MMRTWRYRHWVVMGVLALLSTACQKGQAPAGAAAKSNGSGVQINGAGATFPYPLYAKWFHEYNKIKPEWRFNYQSIGSGGGIQQVLAKTVDFGASDAPMTDEQLQQAGRPILHVPTTLGAVVAAYNVPQSTAPLQFTGELLAKIYLGEITKWNDPQLTALNSVLASVDVDILPAYRADGSGTTHVFTEYLAKVSPSWKERVGTGKSVQWPVGLGGKGNEGVTGLIKQTPGAIGYVELTYAMENKLAYAVMQNAAGRLIAPSIESVTAAASGVAIPNDFRVSLTNPAGADAYPISAFTYLLIDTQPADPAKRAAIVTFLQWALSSGQELAGGLHYAPLPSDLRGRVLARVEAIGK